MRKFIKKIALFLLPFIMLLMLVELVIMYYPNTFNIKAKYINNNKDIEILFLGSSHIQNGVNPKYLSRKAANLAYGGQDYALDSALFFNYVSTLEQLKYVFLELGYHSREELRDATYFRNPWYCRFHDVSVFEVNLLNRISLYYSSPEFFNDYLYKTFITKEYAYDINEYGFIENDFAGRFQDLNYDVEEIKTTFNLVTENSIEKFTYNKRKLLSIVRYCNKNKIKVVLFKPPVFESYSNNYMLFKTERRDALIDSLRVDENIIVMDYEMDKRFDVRDFKNENHLNSAGAKKMSMIVNAEINNWK